MDEQKLFAIDLEGLFPELDDPPKVHGTAGEILERIGDEWGIEEEDVTNLEFPLDGVYPSTRAFRAHQLLEERIHRHDSAGDPIALIDILIKESLVRPISDDEYDEMMEEEELGEYEEARSELDDEWVDGRWEN